jgi:hypothetical protein
MRLHEKDSGLAWINLMTDDIPSTNLGKFHYRKHYWDLEMIDGIGTNKHAARMLKVN